MQSLNNGVDGEELDKDSNFEEVLKQLDFFHDLPKLTCAGQELENAIAAFVSECSLIHDSKVNLESELKSVVNELHSQQRKLESLQCFHKEQILKFQDRNLGSKQKFEDLIRSLSREKEQLTSQCFQLREEASLAKEDQRIKILELIKLKRDLEQVTKNEKLEAEAKKNSENTIQKLKLSQKDADGIIEQTNAVSRRFQDEIDKLRIENERHQITVIEKNRIIEGLQRNLNVALDTKKSSLEQMIKLPQPKVGNPTESKTSVQRNFPDLFLKTILDENAVLVKNEAALKRKLEFVEGTLGCLLDQAKRAIELDSEVLKLNEEIRLLKRSKRVSDDQIEKGTSGVNDNPPDGSDENTNANADPKATPSSVVETHSSSFGFSSFTNYTEPEAIPNESIEMKEARDFERTQSDSFITSQNPASDGGSQKVILKPSRLIFHNN